MEAEQKALESTIRAIVQSSKGTVTVKELERDYYTLENKAVPYKKFGCDTLDRFLKTFDSLFVSGNGALATVRAKVDSSSKHVTSLIDRQKSTNKKAGFIPAPRRGRGNFHYQGPPRNYSEHKTPSYKTYPTSDHRNYPSNETWKPSNAENRRYPTTDSRKYATNEPRKYTSPAEPPKYATTEPSYHRSHSTADSHKYNSMTESSYHRSNSSESSYHRPNVAEETWDNYSGQSHTTSNSRRGGYGASSRGGYSGAVNIAPRFQTKRQIEAVDNARDQLVVNIKDNERQVSYGDGSDDAKHIKTSEEKENIPKMKYNLPPRFQKLKLNNAKTLSQPTEPRSEALSEDLNSRLSPTLREEPKSLLPSHHVALGRALKQAELQQNEEAYLKDFSLPGIPTEAQRLEYSRGILENFSFEGITAQEGTVPHQDLLLDTISSVNGEPKKTSANNLEIPEPDRINVQNNVKILEKCCAALNLPVPEYIVSSRRPDAGRTVMYTATVKITSLDHKLKKHSSWPNENINQLVCKGFAALKALDELQKEKELLTTKTSTNPSIICERIHAMVVDKFTGVVAWSIENEYRKLHQEALPDHWISLAKNYPKLEVESLPTGHIILPRAKYVVSKSMTTPPPLRFPERPLDPKEPEMWDVFVTRASGPNDVSFRLIGEDYDQKLAELIENMERYYKLNANRENALIYECGYYYAACILEDILRVRILEVMEEKRQVSVLLVDHGDTEILPFESLYPLNLDFIELPCQAVSCVLEGLEHYDDAESKLLIATSEDLIGKVLVAEIKHKDEISQCVTVVLFDTSNDEADININEKLSEAIVFQNDAPSLPQANETATVTVSSVSLEGEVYVQVPGPALNKLVELTDSITSEQIQHNKLTGYKDVNMQKIYLAKYSPNIMFCGWYRAVVLNPPSKTSDKITVQFVDYGNIEVIKISDLADITNLPNSLKILPYQAVKVEIQDLPVQSMSPLDMVRLSSLLLDKDVSIMMIDPHRDPPAVYMEVDQEDGTSASVLDAMDSLRALEDEVNNGGGTSFKLMPDLDDDDWLQLKIILCPNPNNFFFQLTKYNDELEDLMLRLQAFYNILPAEAANIEVAVNQTYACLYPGDQAWYRAVVTNVIDDQVCIYLCDYGDHNMVPKANLRQLVPEFNKVPFLAVRASLGGIRPKHVDWQFEDCTRYEQLVQDKVLRGKVLKIENNEDNILDYKVILRLMDPVEKRYIDDLFVSEDRAVSVPL